MASLETILKLRENPDWLPPRSDVRVFIGEPGAPEATKTTIEPGNVFSPGMMTFGVTWWIRNVDTGSFFATELTPLEELHWSYEDGYLPILHCRSQFGNLTLQHTIFQDGNALECSEAVCSELMIHSSKSGERFQVFIALRSLGPAGGEVRDLAVSEDRCGFRYYTGETELLRVDQTPSAIGCGVGDPSILARKGKVPQALIAQDVEGWCFGLLRYDITLQPGEFWSVHYDCPIQTLGPSARYLPSSVSPRPALYTSRKLAHKEEWKSRFGTISVDTPDYDFNNAFLATIQHLLTAMVGEQPRIATLSYPLPWLRDSVFIVRCMDLAGFHFQARLASDYIARNDFFGGFGAEGDAPGEGIWALVQHFRTTGDLLWLEKVYPDIYRKVEWIRKMRQAQRPIQVFQDTPALPFTHAFRTTGIICLPAKDNIIYGTMDFGIEYSIGWVNHWAICGLREAAFAASVIGHTEDASSFRNEATDLFSALKKYALAHPEFFRYERTMNSLLWPTGVWLEDMDNIREIFELWWKENRGDDQKFIPEPYWLYFEAAQAHNALLLGFREWAWKALDYRLRNQDLPGLYGWREGGNGIGTENATRGGTLIPFLRGCHKFESITPHGWSQAELWLLQRAILIEEWAGGLLLFSGVPRHWLKPNTVISFTDIPTWYGKATGRLKVNSDATIAEISVEGLNPGISVEVRLPDKVVYGVTDHNGLQLQVTLL
jgi:hypothetical protein